MFQILANSVPIEERSRAFSYLISAGSVGQTVASVVSQVPSPFAFDVYESTRCNLYHVQLVPLSDFLQIYILNHWVLIFNHISQQKNPTKVTPINNLGNLIGSLTAYLLTMTILSCFDLVLKSILHLSISDVLRYVLT
jgi:hypothetical protein